MVPTYRERLRAEGAALAAAGALGSFALVVFADGATERAGSTLIQLAVVTLVVAILGPRLVRRWMAAARPVEPDEQLTGQPTALWIPPLVVVVLTAVFVASGEAGVRANGWDAGLRITLGCMLVGLVQAFVLERVVAADEERTGRRYVRVPGSRAIVGTKLGFIRNEDA